MLRLAVALFAIVVSIAVSSPGARAQDVTLTGLSYNLGFMTITIPRMEVRGTRLSESDLRGILAPDLGGDLEARLKRLDASSVSMAEVIVEQKIAEATQRIVYRNVRLDAVQAGVVGAMTIPDTVGELRDPKEGTTGFRIGPTEATRLDLPWSARVLLSAEPNPDSQPMRPVYGSFSYRDYVIDVPGPDGGRITIGRVNGREAKARPGKQPLIEDMRKLITTAEQADRAGRRNRNAAPTAEELALIGRMFLFFENVEYGVIDMEAMRADMRVEGEAVAFAIGAMRFSDQAEQGGFALRDLSLAMAGTSFDLAEFEMRDFSTRDSLRGIGQILERGDLAAFITEWPKLIPKLGTIRLSGMRATLPPDTNQRRPRREGTPQAAPDEPTRISLKSGELTFGRQLNGVPTALRLNIEELNAPLPATSRDRNVRDLRAMGLRDLNVSSLVDLAWQDSTNQLDIRSVSSALRGLASFGFAGQLGNVTPEAFSTDTALAQVAWLGATAQRLQIRIQNDGGIDRYIENEARKQRKTPEVLRREWGTAAAVGIPAMLGDSDGVKSLSNALARFIARPGRLSIDIAARQPSGLGVADALAATQNPRGLIDKITIDARAE